MYSSSPFLMLIFNTDYVIVCRSVSNHVACDFQEGRTVSTYHRCLPVQRWKPTWKWPQKNCTLLILRASRARRDAYSAMLTCACTRARPWACTSKTLSLKLSLFLPCPSAKKDFKKDQKLKHKLREEELPTSRGTVHSNPLHPTSPQCLSISGGWGDGREWEKPICTVH